MALSQEKLYKAHVLNIRLLTVGLRRIERELKSAIARRDSASADALLKIVLLLAGGWAECRLQKLIHEPNGFSVSNQQLIAAEPSQLGWWKKALELGFRKRYNLPKAELKKVLKTTAKLRYQELLSVIDTELRPVIEMRNKLAHGQWARPLNSSNTEISTETIAALRNENALTAGFKLSILEHLAIIIHDLVAGNHAFERDFDKHFSNLEDARRNLKTRSYPKWKSSMQDKYDRGRGRRNSNLKT